MEDLKTLKGEVDSIIFKSEDTGFCVLMLNCDNDLITVVGEMGDVEEGEDLVVTGSSLHIRSSASSSRCISLSVLCLLPLQRFSVILQAVLYQA